jgi:hypothetical protein
MLSFSVMSRQTQEPHKFLYKQKKSISIYWSAHVLYVTTLCADPLPDISRFMLNGEMRTKGENLVYLALYIVI